MPVDKLAYRHLPLQSYCVQWNNNLLSPIQTHPPHTLLFLYLPHQSKPRDETVSDYQTASLSNSIRSYPIKSPLLFCSIVSIWIVLVKTVNWMQQCTFDMRKIKGNPIDDELKGNKRLDTTMDYLYKMLSH